MTHIMLDIETWGRRPGSDIRSIGAVVFDPYAGTIANFHTRKTGDYSEVELVAIGADRSDAFYIATKNPLLVDPTGDDAYVYRYPLTREHETIKWWNEQSAEAQAAFANPVLLHHALNSFGMWLEEILHSDAMTQSHENRSLRIWANDPHFDCTILAACYHACDLVEPWHYRAPRSMKTITEAAGMTGDDFKQFDHGTAHNALDDAIAQARIVCEAYKRLGLQK